MYAWVLCGLAGILGCESAKALRGEVIVINGKRVVMYILMLAGGVFTLFYAVYRLFTVSPIIFNSEGSADASSDSSDDTSEHTDEKNNQ